MLSRMNQVQKRFPNWILVSALVLLAGGAAPVGQQRSLGGPAGDVLVDFIAVGANGQPVADLQAADVSIKIAGKARTISSLELKKADSGGSGAASALPAPFATNEAKGGGRSFLIVIDTESLRPGNERSIRESLEPLFKTLGSADRVGFTIAPRDTARVGMDAGLPAVRAALAKFSPNKSSATGTTASNEAICRTSETLLLLRSMIDAIGPGDKPTNVVFFAASLSLPSKTTSSAAQQCEVPTDYYRALSTAVANSRVNMYVVQGDDTIAGRDDGLENLAGVTSAGTVMRTTGAGLARVITESSAYYVASVKPEPDDRPGQTQRLELKVSREGVSTRVRSDVGLTRGAANAGAKPGSVTDMTRTTTAFSELPLRATYTASRGPGGKMTVLTMTEPVDPSVKFKELMVAVIDTSVTPNKIVFPSKADEKQLTARPVTIPVSTDPGGKYRVRVAAIDEAGRAGAVDYDLAADLTPAGPVKLGGLMLLGPRGQSFSPQLLFSSEEEIGLYMELYGDLTGQQVSAKFDIAATAEGPALAETQPGGQGTSEKDKFILNGKLPIAKLAPGDYVVRAIVKIGTEPEGRVYKTLRKVAK